MRGNRSWPPIGGCYGKSPGTRSPRPMVRNRLAPASKRRAIQWKQIAERLLGQIHEAPAIA